MMKNQEIKDSITLGPFILYIDRVFHGIFDRFLVNYIYIGRYIFI